MLCILVPQESSLNVSHILAHELIHIVEFLNQKTRKTKKNFEVITSMKSKKWKINGDGSVTTTRDICFEEALVDDLAEYFTRKYVSKHPLFRESFLQIRTKMNKLYRECVKNGLNDLKVSDPLIDYEFGRGNSSIQKSSKSYVIEKKILYNTLNLFCKEKKIQRCVLEKELFTFLIKNKISKRCIDIKNRFYIAYWKKFKQST